MRGNSVESATQVSPTSGSRDNECDRQAAPSVAGGLFCVCDSDRSGNNFTGQRINYEKIICNGKKKTVNDVKKEKPHTFLNS